MKAFVSAALLLLAAVPAIGQTTPDYSTAIPSPGRWTYGPVAGGSGAIFTASAGQTVLTLRCDSANRRISVSRLATGAAPSMYLWSTSMSRPVATGYDPVTRLLTGQFSAYDRLLDALAFSRGRIVVSAMTAGTLVLPVMPEIARVVEDCRV